MIADLSATGSRPATLRPPAAFPLGPFLDTLAAATGIVAGPRDLRRIARVLSCRHSWSVGELRRALAALLVADPEQRADFDRCFDAFFALPDEAAQRFTGIDLERALAELRQTPQLPPPELPPPAPEVVAAQPPEVARPVAWLVAGTVLAVALLALVGGWLRPSEEAPGIVILLEGTESVGAAEEAAAAVDVPPRPEVETVPRLLTGDSRRYPRAPVLSAAPLPKEESHRWRAPAALSALLLLAAGGQLIWLRRMSRPPADAPLPWLPDAGGRFFDPGAVGGPLPPHLDGDTLDLLADAVSYFLAAEQGRELDVTASVECTIRQGGMGELVYRRRRRLRRVVILEDLKAEALRFNPLAGELAAGLAARGVAVEHGFFEGIPERYSLAGSGEERHLEDVEDGRQGLLLLLFSDSQGTVGAPARFVLEQLARWPQVGWLELREERSWDAATRRVVGAGLPVFPANRNGLLAAFACFLSERGPAAGAEAQRRAAEGWRGEPGRGPGVALPVYLERFLGSALPWAAACAMAPPPCSRGIAESLRARFFPEPPPQAIGRLLGLPGTVVTEAGFRFAPATAAVLRRWFLSRLGEPGQEELLGHLLALYRQAEPPEPSSPAHQGWEWRYRRLQLEVEPEEALARLARLAEGPYRRAIRGDLASAAVGSSTDTASESGAPTALPLRRRPASRRAWQRLLRLAPGAGVETGDAYPDRWRHQVIIGWLAIAGLVAAGVALWLWRGDTPATYALYLEEAGGSAALLEEEADEQAQRPASPPDLVLTLEERREEEWESVASGSVADLDESLLTAGAEYRLTAASGGLAERRSENSWAIGEVAGDWKVELSERPAVLPCLEQDAFFPWLSRSRCRRSGIGVAWGQAASLVQTVYAAARDAGLTGTAEGEQPSWKGLIGSSHSSAAVSIGLDAAHDQAARQDDLPDSLAPAAASISALAAGALQASGSFDISYQLRSRDGVPPLTEALEHIAERTAPSAAQAQLIVLYDSERLPPRFDLAAASAPFGRVLWLPKRWPAILSPLSLVLGDEVGVVTEEEILERIPEARIFGDGPPVLLVRLQTPPRQVSEQLLEEADQVEEPGEGEQTDSEDPPATPPADEPAAREAEPAAAPDTDQPSASAGSAVTEGAVETARPDAIEPAKVAVVSGTVTVEARLPDGSAATVPLRFRPLVVFPGWPEDRTPRYPERGEVPVRVGISGEPVELLRGRWLVEALPVAGKVAARGGEGPELVTMADGTLIAGDQLEAPGAMFVSYPQVIDVPARERDEQRLRVTVWPCSVGTGGAVSAEAGARFVCLAQGDSRQVDAEVTHLRVSRLGRPMLQDSGILPRLECSAPESWVMDGATGQCLSGINVAYAPNELAEATAAVATGGGTILRFRLAEGFAPLPSLKAPKTVNAIAFHPREALLATAGDDDSLLLWDLVTGEHRRLTDHPLEPDLTAIAFSDDGRYLASGDELGGIYIQDLIDGGQPKKLRARKTGRVRDLRFASRAPTDGAGPADGGLLVGGTGGLDLWDQEADTRESREIGGGVYELEVAPDGGRVAVARSYGFPTLFDLDTLKRRELGKKIAYAVAFHPSGRYLATAGYTAGVQLFDLTTEPPALLSISPSTEGFGFLDRSSINSMFDHLEFSPDGRYLVAARHRQLTIFRFADGQLASDEEGAAAAAAAALLRKDR